MTAPFDPDMEQKATWEARKEALRIAIVYQGAFGTLAGMPSHYRELLTNAQIEILRDRARKTEPDPGQEDEPDT